MDMAAAHRSHGPTGHVLKPGTPPPRCAGTSSWYHPPHRKAGRAEGSITLEVSAEHRTEIRTEQLAMQHVRWQLRHSSYTRCHPDLSLVQLSTAGVTL
eukprot:909291-Rhodomonas_salina.3